MIMYVGLFGHSAVVFHVFYVLLTVCVVVFFSVTKFIDLFSCIAASLFNKLTYLLIGPASYVVDTADLTTAGNFTFNMIRYDTRCYFNVRSKADMSQLNLPHGNN